MGFAVARWVGGALACAVCAGCTAAAPPDRMSVARPGQPWEGTPCELALQPSYDMCGGAIDLALTRDGKPAVRLETSYSATLTWSAFPVLGDARAAHLLVQAEGMEVEGWASLAGQRFRVGHNLEIVPSAVWVPIGGEVEIEGTDGDMLVVSVTTPFESPKVIETRTTCDMFLNPGVAPRVPVGPPFAMPRGRGAIALYAEPNGPPVFSFVPKESAAFVFFREQDGFMRITGGPPPWQADITGSDILIDGWVDSSLMQREEEVSQWSESGCHPPDRRDACATHAMIRKSDLLAGPRGARVGSILTGIPVEVVNEDGDFVEIVMANADLRTLDGRGFWVARDDVRKTCDAPPADDLTGCPCSAGGFE